MQVQSPMEQPTNGACTDSAWQTQVEKMQSNAGIDWHIYIRDVLTDHGKIAEYFNCLSSTTDI